MGLRNIIWVAKIISGIFTPFYLPILGLTTLFFLSYLSMLPFTYKIFVLTIVYLFTILIPTFLIRLYRRHQGWTRIELGQKERRMVPYVISITCYITCIYFMESLHIPHFIGSILIAALLVQIICAVINAWWKISTHTAAVGGTGGALIAFAEIFDFNPLWWLCIIFLLAGILGTSRMILRQHSLSQVVVGFCIGFSVSAAGILLM
ncbi:phosphatase PAP2 family protein [Xylanibacter muris]|uniref:Phosphatase PAP2 family protein n=1 Tax=Xylanibacter muris TaxID=2736290 RepID=A0ABX2AIJ6_9BACT|nr:phosphatase PAP2 family protein [Xylanibacter muris]NPD90863.1 hypothetical protein [Xylanibacter muris]